MWTNLMVWMVGLAAAQAPPGLSLDDPLGCVNGDLLAEELADHLDHPGVAVITTVRQILVLDPVELFPAPGFAASVTVSVRDVGQLQSVLPGALADCPKAHEAVAQQIEDAIRELVPLRLDRSLPDRREPGWWVTSGGEVAPGRYASTVDPADPYDDVKEPIVLVAATVRAATVREWGITRVAQVGLGLEASVGARDPLAVTSSTARIHAFGGFVGAMAPVDGADGAWLVGPELGLRVGVLCENAVAQPGCVPVPRFEPRVAARRVGSWWVAGATVGVAVPRLGLDPDQPGIWSHPIAPIWEPPVRFGLEVGLFKDREGPEPERD